MCCWLSSWLLRMVPSEIRCLVRLDKQGFRRPDAGGRMRNKTQEFSERRGSGTNTAPRWGCQNWIHASFIILSATKERMCRELSCNSCGPRTVINNKSITKTNILIYSFSSRYIKHVTLKDQLGNSLGLVFWPQDHILF